MSSDYDLAWSLVVTHADRSQYWECLDRLLDAGVTHWSELSTTRSRLRQLDSGTALVLALSRGGYANLLGLALHDSPNLASVTVTNPEGTTSPLHEAARHGRTWAVQVLLRAGAPLESPDFTPLQVAAAAGHADVVRLLINAGARVDVGDGWDWEDRPLFAAAKSGSVETVKVLLEGGTVDGDTGGWTAIQQAAIIGCDEALQTLLAAGADANAVFFRRQNVLHYAVETCSDQTVELLLEAGVNPWQRARNLRPTPLHSAAANGRLSIVRLLLRYRSVGNIDSKNLRGWTPLHLASCHGNVEIVRALLEAGANLAATNKMGKTARDVACRLKKEAILSVMEEGEWNKGTSVMLEFRDRRAVTCRRM